MDCFYSPYHRHSHRSRTKSSSRLSRKAENGTVEPIRISLDVVHSPPPTAKASSPLPLLRSPTSSLPIRELLLLSPSSAKRSKARFDDDSPEAGGVRRRCKNRTASPRSSRRWKREEKETVAVDVVEVVKQRKRRHSGRHRKERLSLVPFQAPPSTTSSPKADEENVGDLDRVGVLIADLIMWKDFSRSTLWFGFGCLCFLSSCFTNGLYFSIFSTISRLAIVLLGVSFLSNSVLQRNQVKKRSYAKLKEDDILHLAKLILPALNFAISKTKELFSGEPRMTLKVAPFLLLGAEYGHLITIWRLCAIGFFVSFSVPKLYSCYSVQINQRAECLKLRLIDTWSGCTHKKIVMASFLITFWNISSIKTRIFTAFILLVILRYFRQNVDDGEAQVVEKEQQKALVAVAEPEEKEPQHALVVAEQQRQS